MRELAFPPRAVVALAVRGARTQQPAKKVRQKRNDQTVRRGSLARDVTAGKPCKGQAPHDMDTTAGNSTELCTHVSIRKVALRHGFLPKLAALQVCSWVGVVLDNYLRLLVLGLVRTGAQDNPRKHARQVQIKFTRIGRRAREQRRDTRCSSERMPTKTTHGWTTIWG